MAKRIFDIVFSCMGLILLTPLLLLIALVVKLSSPGPVFYRGARLGRYGRPFRVFKFRTMVVDAEKIGHLATPNGDRRVTNVGIALRNYKLDELPQLLNVLRGEMSLVGPRPEAEFYFQYYSKEEKDTILSVRPGITDYGSLHFHDEGKLIVGSDPVTFYIKKILPYKLQLQLQYIRERSFIGDLHVILATIATIVKTRCIKEEPHGI